MNNDKFNELYVKMMGKFVNIDLKNDNTLNKIIHVMKQIIEPKDLTTLCQPSFL